MNFKSVGRLCFIAFVICLGFFCATSAKAQSNTADVVGTVTDATGAVIPGATVTISNTGTNVSQTIISGADGDYTFTLLQVGSYSIKVEAKGFKSFSVPSLALSSGDRARIDAKLEVGDVSQTVEVSGTVAPALQTDTSNVGTLVTSQAVEDLPLNGRNIIKEIQLAPGITEGSPGSIVAGGRPDDRRQTSVFSVNGQSDSTNNQLIDGMDNNERIIGGIGVRPSVDAIQEVNVSTNLYDASAGRTAGGVVDLITKSGTNSLHGSAYEFFRNRVLNANPGWNFGQYLNNVPSTPVNPPFRQNQYGGSIGGPIKKDKTFFFGDFEKMQQAFGVSATETVPTLAEQNSVKSLLAGTSACNCVDFTDVGGTQVPAASIDKIGLAYLQMYPSPTNTANSNNYSTAPMRTQTSTTFDIRVDQHLSDKDTLFGRYSFNNLLTQTPPGFPNVTFTPAQDPLMTVPSLTFNPGGNGIGFAGTSPERQQAFALSYIRVINPNVILSLKAGYLRSAIQSNPVNNNRPISTLLGFPCNSTSCANDPKFPTDLGLADTAITNSTIAYTNLGDQAFTPLKEFDNSFQYAGTVNWIKGAHSVRFGLGVIRRQATIIQSNAGFGAYTFGGYYTNFGIEDLVEGLAGQITRNVSLISPGLRTWEPSTYVQDDWRARSWLTLNLGVRYDIFTPYTEKRGRFSNFDPTTGLLISPSIPGSQQAGATNGVRVDYHDIAPRIGFSATLHHNMVVRGGFGMSYFPTNYQSQYYMKNAPYAFTFSCGLTNVTATNLACPAAFINNTPATFQGGAGFTGGSKLSLGEPDPFLDITRATNTANYPGQTVQAIPFNFPWGYLEQANLTVQKQFGNNVFNIGWVGGFGHHLGSALNINSPANFTQVIKSGGNPGGNPGSTIFPLAITHPFDGNIAVTEEGNYGASAYNALQTSLVRRFSKGLTANIGYTWSHALGLTQACTPNAGLPCYYDKAGAVDSTPATFTQVFSNQRFGWGNTGQDTRHRITWTVNYQLPFASKSSGFESALLKGWAMNAAGSWQTGLPFTVANAAGRRESQTSLGGDSPDQVKSGSLSNRSIKQWLDPTAFVLQTRGTFGDQLPNQFFGPSQRRLDFSLFKDFQVNERLKMQFRTEVFNLFNTTNFNTPNATVNQYGATGGPTNQPGETSAVGPGNFDIITAINGNWNPRQIQFALKFIF